MPGSALAQAVFFYATGRACTLGGLSATYPLAPGSSPLFIALWAGLYLKPVRSARPDGFSDRSTTL